ncbi:MAG: hypothetical protein H0Z33_13400 [Bacillaceae bacterium]|nr:hypothetical protein [Bacillaceae bacterium]
MHFTSRLTLSQLELLKETVESFIEIKKVVHIPSTEGKIVTVPLTPEALDRMIEAFGNQDRDNPITYEFTILPRENDRSAIHIRQGTSGLDIQYDVADQDFQVE